ncbi:MaoC/PaaZ C-terminal domain-containing protein [Paraburkholderia acidiphila]|uniref:3-alpha,7-alpha, 12-alpha-trihydroxy-5-beta-cholest-24-enoyl-CoA hydratase n=1 Tax=Paraburkholderia acidiphila TaxID=2571747 RepID=A0A7Z2J7W2_9BURK|nr:MaoC/PaaZ C-terminal domain-containing protein [Paraburkholderia acidiphila]QGZ55012.1 3-alpha,7-alpha,12-alpha-trihydroxy-5-beta-cholest-24-enoyl-CoA hydratase [Paraburkholderia acidiphila]
MTIDYHTLRNWPFKNVEQTYTARDAMLYSLAVGYGANPVDSDDLAFVYEKALRVPPTLAVVLGFPGFWARDPRAGIDWVRLLHGEQSLVMHKPLPAAATVIGRSRITRVVDKGAGKGALLEIQRSITDKASGELYATVTQLTFCRGDGGFSANNGLSDEAPAPPPPMPERAPDHHCDLPTRPETALIYRLCGDDNALHADPHVARAAGFERPILHGLATWGVAAHAVLKTLCASDPQRLAAFHARFTAPVYPGETIRTEMWRDGNEVSFRARVLERDVLVLNHGRAQLR